MPHTSFHERVANTCGRISRELRRQSEVLRSAGLMADAAVTSAMAETLEKLAYDALMDTQPIEVGPGLYGTRDDLD